jgi:hypothetical protein
LKATIPLMRAKYYAGIDRPWFASRSAVRSALTKTVGAGVTGVRFHDRDEQLPVNPRVDPRYSDEWDEWIELLYEGVPRSLETERVWAWLVRVSVPNGQAMPTLAPEVESKESAIGLLGFVVPAALLWYVARRR